MIDIKPTRSPEGAINITPLVDIVFLLLIFFLLTAFFIQPEGMDVKLPSADGSLVETKDEIVVVIDEAGRIFVDSDVPIGVDRLRKKVRVAADLNPDLTVVVKADRATRVQTAVSVMEACKKAGAARLVIATERDPSGTPALDE